MKLFTSGWLITAVVVGLVMVGVAIWSAARSPAGEALDPNTGVVLRGIGVGAVVATLAMSLGLFSTLRAARTAKDEAVDEAWRKSEETKRAKVETAAADLRAKRFQELVGKLAEHTVWTNAAGEQIQAPDDVHIQSRSAGTLGVDIVRGLNARRGSKLQGETQTTRHVIGPTRSFPHYLLVHRVPWASATGKQEVAWFIQDITSLVRRTLKRHKDYEQRHRLLLRAVPFAEFVVDENGMVVEADSSSWPAADQEMKRMVVGQPLAAAVKPEQAIAELVRTALAKGGSHGLLKWRGVASNKHAHVVLAKHERSGRLIGWIADGDRTARAELEVERLSKRLQEAEDVGRSLAREDRWALSGRFHSMKGTLSMLKSDLGFVLNDPASCAPYVLETLKEAKKKVDGLDALTDRLHDYSRDVNLHPLVTPHNSANEVIVAACETAERVWKLKVARTLVEGPLPLTDQVLGLLDEAVEESLRNAKKYGNAGGASVACSLKDGGFRVVVQNDGPALRTDEALKRERGLYWLKGRFVRHGLEFRVSPVSETRGCKIEMVFPLA